VNASRISESYFHLARFLRRSDMHPGQARASPQNAMRRNHTAKTGQKNIHGQLVAAHRG